MRFFAHPRRAQKAKSFIQRLELDKEDALITEIVFAEVAWVLNKVYNIPRQEIAEKFLKIINYKGVKTILNKEIFSESLRLYANHSMDIQDIFLAVLSRNKESSIITFDKDDFKRLQCNYSEP